MAPTKLSTSFRLSDDARVILAQIADETGLSQASVIELALRDLAAARARAAKSAPKKRPSRPADG